VDETVPYNPGTGKFPQWEDLDDKEREMQARKMEIYAAMVENIDSHIGRLFDALKKTRKYENTIIFFMSDNGANPKEASFYPGSSEKYLNENYDNSFKNMGKRDSFVSLGGSWAEVCNTPFTYFKTTTGAGGIHAPLIISGAGVEIENIKSNTGIHVCDIFPTVLDLVGVSRPNIYNGNELAPLYGISGMKFLTGNEIQVRNTSTNPLHFEMIECRAVIKGSWKALMLQPPYVSEPHWQLFDLSSDLLEKHDLALQEPEKLKELIAEWDKYAISVGYIKAEGEPLIQKIGSEEFYKFDSRNK